MQSSFLCHSCVSLQILDPQDLEEFPAKPLDSQHKDSSLINASEGLLSPCRLDSLGQSLELELGLGAGVGAGAGAGPGLGQELESRAIVGSSLGAGLNFGVDAGIGEEAVQRRLSLQDPHTPLDSRTPERHSSDPGGS